MQSYRESEDWILIQPEEEDLHYTQWEVVSGNDHKSSFEPPLARQTYADAVRKPAPVTVEPARQAVSHQQFTDLGPRGQSASSKGGPLLSAEEEFFHTRRLRNLENSARTHARLNRLLNQLDHNSLNLSPREPERYDYKITIEGKKEPVEFFAQGKGAWWNRNHLQHPCWCKRGGRVSKNGSKGFRREFRESVDEVTRTLDYYY